jgi:hypothetical protein
MIQCPHCGNQVEIEDIREDVCLDCYARIHSADLEMRTWAKLAKKSRRKFHEGENDAFACFGVDLQ